MCFLKTLSIITQEIALRASFVDFQYLRDHTKKKKIDHKLWQLYRSKNLELQLY